MARPDAASSPLLEIEELRVSYGPIAAIKGVSLAVHPGEVVALLGANGAGKSTLLRTISGLIRPRAGRVRFAGRPIDRLAPPRIVRLGIAHAPEGRRVFGSLSVADNLRLGAVSRRERASLADERDQLLTLFPILRERLHQAAGTLSGGEQQMLALARALMAKPRLLLLDEPSLGLAPLVVRTIFGILAGLRREGVTMLLVEQNVSLALELADRAYVLRTGEIRLEGPTFELRTDPDRIVHAYLGAATA